MKSRDKTPTLFAGLEYPNPDPFRRGSNYTPAAKADPATSHEAARRMVESGKLNEQGEAVLALVLRWPGRTSAELAANAEAKRIPGIDRHIVARRLPEIERSGRIFRGAAVVCKANGTKAQTWWPQGFKEISR